MSDDRNKMWQFPLPLSIGTCLVFIVVGLGYFLVVAWLVSSEAVDPLGAVRATIIHGLFYTAVMTWLWLPSKTGVAVKATQVTLPGIFGIMALIAISISFATQVLVIQAWLGPTVWIRKNIGPIVFYSLIYFVCSLPFAIFLGMGLMRLWQIVSCRIRR